MLMRITENRPIGDSMAHYSTLSVALVSVKAALLMLNLRLPLT